MANYGQGESSGKIILMGEHAVVYGEPSDCLSFYATKVTAFLEELDAMDDQLVSSYYSGNLAEAPHTLKISKIIHPFKKSMISIKLATNHRKHDSC